MFTLVREIEATEYVELYSFSDKQNIPQHYIH